MDLVKKIGIGLANVVVWIMLGCIGFAADSGRGKSIPIWLAVFAAIYALVYIYEAKKSREYTADTPKSLILGKKVLGVLLLIASVAAPSYLFKSANFSMGIHAMLIGLSAVLVVVGGLAVVIINSTKGKNIGATILGYLLLIVLSAVPGFAMIQHDQSYDALGMAYYAAVAVAVFAWLGASLAIEKR